MVLVWAVVACGGGETGDNAADATAAVADAMVPGPTETYEVTIGPVTVPAGEEDTVCVVLELGNVAAGHVRAIQTQLSQGTHHVIVNFTDEAAHSDPQSCGVFAGTSGHGALAFIAQQPTAEIRYPAGTGLPIDANQRVHLEMHYFNYLPSAEAAISASVRFEVAGPGQQLAPIQLMFSGGGGEVIAPNSTGSWTSFHTVPDAARIFALTTHMHQLGVRGTIHRVSSQADPEGQLIYETTSWSEPPLQMYEPFALDSSEGLRLRCDYVNPTDQPVGFGLGFADEMCFVWGHYYVPSTSP